MKKNNTFITTKDWKDFTEMLDIIDKVNFAKTKKQMDDHFKELERTNAKRRVRAAKMGVMYFPVWSPCHPITFTPYKKSIEGCLSWVVEGKPVFAKKLKVKSVKI